MNALEAIQQEAKRQQEAIAAKKADEAKRAEVLRLRREEAFKNSAAEHLLHFGITDAEIHVEWHDDNEYVVWWDIATPHADRRVIFDIRKGLRVAEKEPNDSYIYTEVIYFNDSDLAIKFWEALISDKLPNVEWGFYTVLDYGKVQPAQRLKALFEEWEQDPCYTLHELAGMERHREELETLEEEYWSGSQEIRESKKDKPPVKIIAVNDLDNPMHLIEAINEGYVITHVVTATGVDSTRTPFSLVYTLQLHFGD